MLRSTSSFGVAVRPTSRRVEVVEDRPVLLVDRAVRLVDHDQVEVAGAEAALAVARLVDQVHHRRVGRDVDTRPSVVLLGDQVDRRGVGQVRLEGVDGLVHQRDAVGEEQHALDPVGPHQQVDQRDDRAGLAGAGRHHQQRLALAGRARTPRRSRRMARVW